MMFGRAKASKPPAPKPLRTGVYTMEVVGASFLNKNVKHWPIVDVAEWEVLGNLSRVTVLDISGVPRTDERRVRDLVGKWIPTAAVVWRNA